MVQRFFAALVYFTRIPSPVTLRADANLGAASFAPLIGCIVAVLSILVVWLAEFVFPDTIVVALGVVSAIWITGAMHEDGWADFCDGFGGGWTREQTMDIMRDSRTGVFGIVGLLSLLSIKFLALAALFSARDFGVWLFPLALLTGHVLSRFVAISFMYSHDYATSEQPSRAKSMTRKMSAPELAFSGAAGLLPLFALMAVVSPLIGLALLPIGVARFYFSRLFSNRLGGYTGDCLGAVQQVTEVVVYLSLLAALSHL